MSNLTRHGNNADIQVHPLSDYIMRYLGFTDYEKSKWYKWKHISGDITFNVTINKDGSDWKIVVIDEDILQPYDYQYLLKTKHPPQIAHKVKEFVDDAMMKLVNVGIVSNWKVGDYV